MIVYIKEKKNLLREIFVSVNCEEEFKKALNKITDATIFGQYRNKRLTYYIARFLYETNYGKFIQLINDESLRLEVCVNHIVVSFSQKQIEYYPYRILKNIRKLKPVFVLRIDNGNYKREEAEYAEKWHYDIARKILKYGIIPSEITLSNLISKKYKINVKEFASCYEDYITPESFAKRLATTGIQRQPLEEFVDFIIKGIKS